MTYRRVCRTTVASIADGYAGPDFILRYGGYIGTQHRVVERVCLPAGSTVTHDFAVDGAAIRKSPVRLSGANGRPRHRGICSLTTGGGVDHYHPRRKQISLSPRSRSLTFDARACSRVRRHWPISARLEKKLANRFARGLSISGTA